MSERNVAHQTDWVALLGVAFIVLKLCGVISWPWLWVLAPFWVGLALLLGILVIGGLVIGITQLPRLWR